MKRHLLITTGCLALLASSATAATLINTDFESGSISPWTVNSVANTGLYQHNVQLQPTGTVNYATSGDFAVSLAKSGGTMTSTIFDLSAGGLDESITLDLSAVWINATSTRRTFIETSLDGGTNWFWLATLQQDAGAGSLTFGEGSSSVTRSGIMRATSASTTAWDGSAFTDQMVIRIRNQASAGADVRIFVDDTVVSTTVPEPSAALLGGLGLVALLRRRR
jgi:uncharacterized protein (TIGR03382 family)